MARRFSLFLMMLACVVLTASAQTTDDVDGADPHYRFTYIGQSELGKIDVHYYDPATQLTETIVHRLLTSEGRLYYAIPSPTHNWTAVVWSNRDPRGYRVSLVNSTTQQFRDMHFVAASLSGGSFEFYQEPSRPLDIAWSPDGRKLAIVGEDFSTSENVILIYDIFTFEETYLPNPDTEAGRIAWSDDGQSLVVNTYTCDQYYENCAHTLRIYETDTWQATSSVLLPPRYDFARPEGLLCRLRWSPDKLYISFLVGCGHVGEFGDPTDILLYDIGASEIRQVTDFTLSAPWPEYGDSNIGTFGADLDSIWYDNTHLLVGGEWVIDETNNGSGIWDYDVLTRQLTQVDTTDAVGFYKITKTNQLVFLDVTLVDSGWQPLSMQTTIASYSPLFKTLVRETVLPSGCVFSVSPDGEWLTYGAPSRCTGGAGYVHLYNFTTGEVRKLDTDRSTISGLYIGGWARTVNQAPIADAGQDQTVVAGADGKALVTLDASNSIDPDGEIMRYDWILDQQILANGEVTQVVLEVGTHQFRLAVIDSDHVRSEDTVTITVLEP